MQKAAHFINTALIQNARATTVAWPVHANSFRVLPKAPKISRPDAYRIYREARNFDREGRKPHVSRGSLGTAALRVLETLVYDFLNYTTGRLDPAYETIAERANLARSTVAEALKRLQTFGVIRWLRRCSGEMTDAGWRLKQDSNVYELRPPEDWLGYRPRPAAKPTPLPHEIGARPPLPDTLSAAGQQLREKASTEQAIATLALDEQDELAQALASWGRLLLESESKTETGSKLDSS